jgi:hypothetical protein
MTADVAAETNAPDPDPEPPPARMLLDTPAQDPSLDFAATATALAHVIERSEPRFAIGIFGGWGAGKTTLMDAIETRLTPSTSVVVRFNAWRFERELHILVPLLDAVREGLATWASAHEEAPTRAERARNVARRIGGVVRALATGVSAEVGISEAAKVKYDVGKAIDALNQPEEIEAEQAQSLYFAGFLELERAFTSFAEDGATRVVVFVDDLDRCLPANALEVLESMKLFFDLPGFVFVVGLDEQIVDRAVRTKLGGDSATGTAVQADTQQLRLGQEYVKKIFQVPYALPPVPSGSVDNLLASMYREGQLGPEQVEDLRNRVRPFLDFIAIEGRINPREVKRFINAYTLQMLVRPGLDRDTVLPLQTMVFRQDWEVAYSALLADSELFRDAVNRYRAGADEAIEDVWPRDARTPMPADFIRFIRSPHANPLGQAHDLESYLFSLQSTRGSNPRLIQMLGDVGRLRRLIREAGGLEMIGDESGRIASEVSEIVSRHADEPLAVSESDQNRITGLLERLASDARRLAPSPGGSGFGNGEERAIDQALVTRMQEIIQQLQQELTVVRRSSLLPS